MQESQTIAALMFALPHANGSFERAEIHEIQLLRVREAEPLHVLADVQILVKVWFQRGADERDVGLALVGVEPELGATRLPGEPGLHARDGGVQLAVDVELLVRRIRRNHVQEVHLLAGDLVRPVLGRARERCRGGRRQPGD